MDRMKRIEDQKTEKLPEKGPGKQIIEPRNTRNTRKEYMAEKNCIRLYHAETSPAKNQGKNENINYIDLKDLQDKDTGNKIRAGKEI